jgi:hypothetical protein
LTEQEKADLLQKLPTIHTGEMAPYYIMRYGFYESHTDYLAIPIAIALFSALEAFNQSMRLSTEQSTD